MRRRRWSLRTRSIVVVLLAELGVTGCEPTVLGDCMATAIDEAISPDGRYVAALSHGECSTAPELRTSLSLREARDGFDPAAQRPLVTVEGHRELAFEWSAAGSLTVALPQSGVLERQEAWRDVRIDYE